MELHHLEMIDYRLQMSNRANQLYPAELVKNREPPCGRCTGLRSRHLQSKLLPHEMEMLLCVYSLHCPAVSHSNVLPSFHSKPQKRKKSFRAHIEVVDAAKKTKNSLIHPVLLLHVHRWLKSKHKLHNLVTEEVPCQTILTQTYICIM